MVSCQARNAALALRPKLIPFVMPGLDPGIHPLQKTLDCRVKPGNDDKNI
jgi:hypothetical protein